MSRDYPNRPFVGVGIVVWKEDHVLLIKRGKAPRNGEWSLPGGAQHLGETVQDAALREVMEETGLTIKIAGLIDVVDAIRHDENGDVLHHYTLVDYAATWVSGEAHAGDDAIDVKWVPMNEIEDYLEWDETIRIIHQSAFLVGHTNPHN